jgi:uncharacterized SAM-dependent methyltransferase
MATFARLAVHPSQFPENVRRDLIDSLRSRQLHHKFHYDSIKQAQKWLELHEAYSPSRIDPDCAAVYDRCLEEAIHRLPPGRRVQVAGLGCGGGQKEARLLQRLRAGGREVFYAPSDVSTALVLTARAAALEFIPDDHCSPVVLDLNTTDDLAAVLDQLPPVGVRRIVTFFGMIPNFDPHSVWPKLAGLLGPEDILLLSANLAPGGEYDQGVRRVLPQYDNPLTRDWLMVFPRDIGAEEEDGDTRFVIEEAPPGSGLKRIAAYFHFRRPRKLPIGEHRFVFDTGDAIRLFFSYRYSPAHLRSWAARYGLQVRREWITRSEEEGVFLLNRLSSFPAPPESAAPRGF